MRRIFTLLTGLVISATSFAQSWSLTGNAGTTPGTNFLGTTDNNRVVFKSNATEFATILPSGNVGIGLSAPAFNFQVFSSTGANQAAITGTAPALTFIPTAAVVLGQPTGRIGLATGAGSFVSTSATGDFVIQQSDTSNSLIFGTNQNSGGNGLERMRINKIGYVGISTTSPTAKLDVNCVAVTGQTNPSNIRFENLPKGQGKLLVIDANGYVFVDSTDSVHGASLNNPLVTQMQNQIEEMRSQLDEMRSLLTTKLALNQAEVKKLQNETAGYLGDVHPNPANGSTTIDYSLPAGTGAATCQVYSLGGAAVTTIVLPATQGRSQVQLNTSQLAAGMYIYALVVDGKVLDTKKLAVVR